MPVNGGPPVVVHVNPRPVVRINSTPGVGIQGPPGPTGATGATGPPGHPQLALSLPGTLQVQTGDMPFISTRAITIVGIRVAAGVAPTGGDVVFDVLVDGSTIFTTVGNRPRIAAGSTENAALAVPDITTVAAGAVITVDVIQVGSIIAGSNAVLVIDNT